ncbi:hypothetical protein BCR32DRAFT_294516 [Anaeromyces robustus]|uniref:Uncharacterized protein n=1 Tax=Anaeromyces robustus TaxID=1754192 RepID=A0A1Y1X0J8_9FUNG|nr:hypothetical protein BCR32DRAFT_294516 [Anaeromyces robustus]|eukprot:ORX79331.1 hypothetical protein BCR32DRAFT_294516 [Anaeromyces robustus]
MDSFIIVNKKPSSIKTSYLLFSLFYIMYIVNIWLGGLIGHRLIVAIIYIIYVTARFIIQNYIIYTSKKNQQIFRSLQNSNKIYKTFNFIQYILAIAGIIIEIIVLFRSKNQTMIEQCKINCVNFSDDITKTIRFSAISMILGYGVLALVMSNFEVMIDDMRKAYEKESLYSHSYRNLYKDLEKATTS